MKYSQVYYTIFKDLHEKGFFVMDGTKFGADFVIYESNTAINTLWRLNV